jgi:glycosyltransferase involved in cell wall biosynthesis
MTNSCKKNQLILVKRRVLESKGTLPSAVWKGSSVLTISNAARQAVRTIDFLRVLQKNRCSVNIIAWKRGSKDNFNHPELVGIGLRTIESKNVFTFIIKSLWYGLHKPSRIYTTVDIRFVPLIIFLAKLNRGVAIYDSKELPSVVAKLRIQSIRLPKILTKLKNFIYRGYQIYETICFKLVDGILCLDTKDDFLYHGVKKLNKNTEIIMNSVGVISSLVQGGEDKFRKVYENDLPIIFSGGLDPDKGFYQYFEAIKVLKNEIHNIKFIVCGTTHLQPFEFQSLIKKYDLCNYIDFYERMPFNEHLGLLKSCKVGLALMNPENPKYKLIGPGTARKLFTYMAAGLPIIMSKGHFARIIEEEKCGLTVDFLNTSELVKALRYLLTNEKERILMAQNGLMAFESKYNMKIEGVKISMIIDTAFRNCKLSTSRTYY